MPTTITGFDTHDLRFPTSDHLDGSDAMNPDPDYSAACIVLKTSSSEHTGHGMTFTIGRGNELCVAGIRSLAELLVGSTVESLMADPVTVYRRITGDSQLRWTGPEKGVIHMAAAAVINAVWDVWCQINERPLWRLIAEMTPEQFVASVDFRYLTQCLNQSQATEILRSRESGKQERIEQLLDSGFPSYTTSAGWLGYSDEELRGKCADLMDRGWNHFKIKVGRDLDDDLRRCRILRAALGPEARMMVDANQVWEVSEAIEWIQQLKEYDLWFVEEPTSPDDILGHAEIAKAVAPIRIATGEVCHNRIMFRQFMESGGMQVCQLDSCRIGGVNEVLAVMLLAQRFGIPVCPHAGGVGLCEYVQHLAMIDYICVSGTLENRIAEYSDHLHEQLRDPVTMKNGRYMPPQNSGYSVEFLDSAINQFSYTG